MGTLFKPFSTVYRVTGNIIRGLLLISLTLIFSSAALLPVNSNYSGEWNFNEGKSKLAEGRFRAAAQTIKVTQDDAAVSIERTSNTPNGDAITTTEKLTFDGKTTESTVFGNSKKTSTAAWSSGGDEMTIQSTIVFERDGNSFEIKISEVWKLQNDGKTLSIDYTSTSPRGTQNQTFVYDKK